MKHLPNLFTLLNLLCGCIAIVFILQTGQSIVILNDTTGAYDPLFPEKMAWGGLFIFLAAVVDFFDGFFARMLKSSSEMGKQLDSLSDVVSFGVAPGLIIYQLLRLGFAQEEGGLDVSVLALLPAFIFPAAVALRLAKFNISTTQTEHFEGVPSPAAGLVIASLPLIIWNQYFQLQAYFINVWVLYATVATLAYLMLSKSPFMALKFKDFSLRHNAGKFGLLAISLVPALVLRWLAVPVIFLLYVAFSKFIRPGSKSPAQQAPLDITV